MPLTHFQLTNAKPAAKPYKLSDGGGLHIIVKPSGSKLWRLKYRFLGKERLLSFGEFPLFSLAEARTKRDEAKKLLASGVDPNVKKKLDQLAAETAARNTFGLVAEEFINTYDARGAAETTKSKQRWLLLDIAAPLAHRPIAEITPAEILDLLKRIERSGRRETARRLRSRLSAVFRYAIVTLRASADPTVALTGAITPPKVTHRAAITDERQLGGLLRAIDEFEGWPTVKAALLFTALTCARPGEVRGARRSEIDFAKALWRIPAERTKMRRPHDVPLSRQAIDVLRDIWTFSDHGELVFPSIISSKKLLSENALNGALRRLGFGPDEMTAHGFRATASTILNERGARPDVIEAMLGHQNENAVRRAYNRASYWPERVELMQRWADMLDEFRALPTA
ncbi:tyrosine-type recombinase/integrase [Methylocystis sp. FS]|uniref:tyrosine-type recombinase/integrase n=1 Tax=Methylocystis silviterrae TaxID=2743612 RepID=UPI001582DE1B|nr:integrase arm-type DNA-binding domain-containing protein [Methylocystis silviterrae]NUJ80265.1 tyrosine-type recombinase/integrase [Methylocystis silviterrae]